MDGRYAAGAGRTGAAMPWCGTGGMPRVAGRTGAAMPWTGSQDFCSRQILSTCIHAGNNASGRMHWSADIELH